MKHYKFNDELLKFEPAKRYDFRALALIALFILLVGFGSAVKVNTVLEKIPIMMEHKDEECNSKTVWTYIKQLNLKYPEVVYRQCICELDHFRSPIFHTCNNIMGMEYTKGRPTLGQNIGNRFAKYNNWKESLADYCIWQGVMAGDIRNESEYYELLDKVYCPDSDSGVLYSARLKQIPLPN